MTSRPNALIVGAGKAGSTSLHNYLASHPEIFGSKQKELMYFTTNHDKGLDWYHAQFPEVPGTRIWFESTPQYTFRDEFPEAAPRIHAYDPDMRLIYIVREPISRIVSHFNHWSRVYPERYTDIEDSLTRPGHRKAFVERTRYFHQISAYLDLFPAEQVQVVFMEDLRSDFVPALNRVFDFLGVAPCADTIRPKVHNKRPEREDVRVWSAADISETRKDELRGYLGPDVQRLLAHCGKPTDFWGAGYT